MGVMVLKRAFFYIFLLPFVLLLPSCSDKDHIDVIPANSIAVASIDARQVFGDNLENVLGDVLKSGEVIDCGIDWTVRLYAFETVDGSVGLSAKVSDDSKLTDWLNGLSENGYCTKVSKDGDFCFTVMQEAWVIGFSSDAMLAFGPVLPAAQVEIKRKIADYLGQDSDNSIKSSPLFGRLDSLSGPLTLVAQAAALPEKFAAPFMLGVPKDADASQVMIAAAINSDAKDCVVINGETFSLNNEIDDALKHSRQVYRPITQKYIEKMPVDAACGVFMNVDGAQFINQLHSNKTFQAILAGANMAIDMDNIIKSIDGDVAVISHDLSSKMKGLEMYAVLKDKKILGDVNYWKQSCPPGSKITDKGKDAYCYTNGELTYFFGVTPDMQFYMGNAENTADILLNNTGKRLPVNVVSWVKGSRLALVLNVEALFGVSGDSSGRFVKSLFGGAKTVLYIMK